MCTYPDCSEPDTMYASRTSWLDHEAEVHRKVWRCFEHTDIFMSKNALRHHLEITHPDIEEPHTSGLIDLAHATAKDERSVCPFCLSDGPFVKSLANHMAFHMERLATFAVPRNVEDVDGESSTRKSSKSAQGDQSASSLKSVILNFSSAASQDSDTFAVESVAPQTGKRRRTPSVDLSADLNT
jgi:hypothetical protein